MQIIDAISVPIPNEFSLTVYKDSAVLMYGGRCGKVTFRCDDILLKNAVDRFGEDSRISRNTGESFDMSVSGSYEGLLYWYIRFPDCCEILEPIELREKTKGLMKKNKYGV